MTDVLSFLLHEAGESPRKCIQFVPQASEQGHVATCHDCSFVELATLADRVALLGLPPTSPTAHSKQRTAPRKLYFLSLTGFKGQCRIQYAAVAFLSHWTGSNCCTAFVMTAESVSL